MVIKKESWISQHCHTNPINKHTWYSLCRTMQRRSVTTAMVCHSILLTIIDVFITLPCLDNYKWQNAMIIAQWPLVMWQHWGCRLVCNNLFIWSWNHAGGRDFTCFIFLGTKIIINTPYWRITCWMTLEKAWRNGLNLHSQPEMFLHPSPSLSKDIIFCH
jgi:hypothetical protein